MVEEALQEKEACFVSEHASDTDAQLAAYLRECAAGLGHTPHAKEIVGWQYILARFGTWEKALYMARLPHPSTPKTPSKFQLVLDEYENQQKIYRQKKADKKQKHQQRMQKQAEQRRLYAQEQEKLKNSKNDVQSGTPLPLGASAETATDFSLVAGYIPDAGHERQPASGTTKTER